MVLVLVFVLFCLFFLILDVLFWVCVVDVSYVEILVSLYYMFVGIFYFGYVFLYLNLFLVIGFR